MAYLLVRHKVRDYNSWKPGFDDHSGTRKAQGSRGGMVFRNADDPNEVLILMEWDNLENARRFADSDDLKEKMEEVGVTDRPDVYYLEKTAEPSK